MTRTPKPSQRGASAPGPSPAEQPGGICPDCDGTDAAVYYIRDLCWLVCRDCECRWPASSRNRTSVESAAPEWIESARHVAEGLGQDREFRDTILALVDAVQGVELAAEDARALATLHARVIGRSAT